MKREYNETIKYVETSEPDKVADYIEDLKRQLDEKDKELVPLKETVDTLYDEIGKWESGEYISSKIGKMFEKSLDEKEQEIRHQVCQEIREKGELRIALYDGTEFYAIKKEVLDQIEGEKEW